MEDTNGETKLLKVSSTTAGNKLASSIHTAYAEDPSRPIKVRVIGAGALNQAIKGVIISNKQFVREGLIASALPSFSSFYDEARDKEITAIMLTLKINNI